MNKFLSTLLFIVLFISMQGISFADNTASGTSSANYNAIKQQGMEAYNKGDYATALKYLTSIPKSQHTR